MSILPQLEHCSSKKMNTWLGVWAVGEGVGQGQRAGGDKGLRNKSVLLCVIALTLSGDGGELDCFQEERGAKAGVWQRDQGGWPDPFSLVCSL